MMKGVQLTQTNKTKGNQMSHGISKIDKHEGTEQAWHGNTDVKSVIELAECWLAQWDILKSPLYTLNDKGNPVPTEYCQLVATDDNNIRIGSPVHCDTYQPVTNRAFLETVRDAISGITGATVASVGSVAERGKVFVSVKLAELEAFKAAGREFKAYLNFLNSHDQSTAFLVNTSNICTVCQNTFGMNLRIVNGVRSGLKAAKENSQIGDVRIKLKHTKNVALRLENIGEIIDGFLGAQAEFHANLEAFAKRQIDAGKARNLFAGFLGKPDAELSTRKENQINRLTELFQSGKGNRGENHADVFSAVTDYFTHESSGGENVSRQIVASEYGSGQTAKARMYGILQNEDAVAKMIETGKQVLAVA
jgi:hypothetical protein